MNLRRSSGSLIDVFIENPVKVAAVVILVVLFGLLTVTPPSIMPSPIRVPVQLTPNMDQPIVTVSTTWEGASPEEVERELIEPQEEMLKGINNLRKMTSSAGQGSASIELEFEVGTDQNVAKQDASDGLRRVKYQIPTNDFDNPTVKSGRDFGEEAIAWMILFPERKDIHVPHLFDFIDDQVKPVLERVGGMASVRVFGGLEREIQVEVDALKLAQGGVTFTELEIALQAQNRNISAGSSAQGKRDVVIRTMGQFDSLEDIRTTVIKTGPGGPIRVRDVAQVVDTYKKRYGFVRSKGQFVIAMAAFRETDTNVIQVMEGLKEAIAKVNRDILAHRDLKLELTQVYDQTTYITSSINLVTQNLFWGGALAVAVLVVFLRSLTGTAVVAVSIPISVIGTFLIIPLAGRNINVVMLAGLAFAVGMVVDNAIVVLENIYRHREMGKSRRQAASDGAQEVWGAVLANSLTTMVVFLPIIFVQEEAGQLFRDIAIAISGAVGLSLLVSITVVPPLASRILAQAKIATEGGGDWFARAVARLVRIINTRVLTRLAVVLGFTGASVWLSGTLAPQPSYLPSGNRNLIFGFLLTPPGYNATEFARIAERLENGDPSKGQVGLRRFWEVQEGTPEYQALLDDWFKMVDRFKIPALEQSLAAAEKEAGDGKLDSSTRKTAKRRIKELKREIAEWRVPPPPIDNFFYVDFGGGCFMGCSSRNAEVVKPLTNVLNSTGFSIPDSFAIFFQTSIFQNIGAGNSVDVEVRGDDLDGVISAGRGIMMACQQAFGAMPETNPRNFMLERREDRLIPDRVKAGDVGLTTEDLGHIIRACGDGRIVGQYREKGDSIDLAVKVAGTEDPINGRSATSMIAEIPIYTPVGQIVPLRSLCGLVQTTAPQQINHIETQRSVKLTIRPPEGISLPEVLDTVENKIVASMRQPGPGGAPPAIGPEVIVTMAGNADKLKTTWDSLKWLLLLSFLVVYLLMAGLFESFAYPFVIIFTVPFAVVGGFIGLRLVNEWTWSDPNMAIQQLDMLTILGFVILLGIVVNNGILIVHQSLNFIQYGMDRHEAIVESVRTRIRPIFMTVLTTFFGQLMLVLRPGAGAELYRGLGAVVLGGLLLSTLLTLLVVPAMLSLFLGAKERLLRKPRSTDSAGEDGEGSASVEFREKPTPVEGVPV